MSAWIASSGIKQRIMRAKRFMRSVVLVDEVDDDFDHDVFFFSPAFGNHEGEGDERVVCDAFVSVRSIENAVAVINQRKSVAAIRLFPSEKEWFLVTR